MKLYCAPFVLLMGCSSADPGTTSDAGDDVEKKDAGLTSEAGAPPFAHIVEVAAGRGTTCALDLSGAVYCWGKNTLGQLGTESKGDSVATPAAVAGLPAIRHVAANGFGDHVCAVDLAGFGWCWGANDHGQLGSNAPADSAAHATPGKITDGTADFSGIDRIFVGPASTCLTKTDGSVYCWGSDDGCQVGDAVCDGGAPIVPHPVRVASGLTATSVAIGTMATCAAGKTTGTTTTSAYCWGKNANDDLGAPLGKGLYPAPQPVAYAGSAPVELAAGFTHTCLVDDAKNVYCWGQNQGNAAGLNDGGFATLPFQVTGYGGEATAIAAGFLTTCAIVRDGALKCMGSNTSGELGSGDTTTSSASPLSVKDLVGTTFVAVGDEHACAVARTSAETTTSLYCWGGNANGELGDGTKVLRRTPVHVTRVPRP
jgi:alpha-tubulin suppressor-like RCC1 family protein